MEDKEGRSRQPDSTCTQSTPRGCPTVPILHLHFFMSIFPFLAALCNPASSLVTNTYDSVAHGSFSWLLLWLSNIRGDRPVQPTMDPPTGPLWIPFSKVNFYQRGQNSAESHGSLMSRGKETLTGRMGTRAGGRWTPAGLHVSKRWISGRLSTSLDSVRARM